MAKGYWLLCDKCGEKLVAKSKRDGRVETWHRDAPCESALEDRQFRASAEAIRNDEAARLRAVAR